MSSPTQSASTSIARPTHHLTFSHGNHFCIGSGLARLEMRVMFEEIIRRMTDIELVGTGRMAADQLQLRHQAHADSASRPAHRRPGRRVQRTSWLSRKATKAWRAPRGQDVAVVGKSVVRMRKMRRNTLSSSRRCDKPRARRLFLLLAVSLAGCTLIGPDFKRPSAPIAPKWSDTGDPRVDNGYADFPDWWNVFNDADLTRLIALAYRNNLTLRAAGLRVLEARAQLGIADR